MTPLELDGPAHPAHAQRGGLRRVGRAAARARRASPDPALHQHRGDRYAGVARRVARGSGVRRLARAHVEARRRSVCRAARPARVAHESRGRRRNDGRSSASPARPRRSRRRRHGCPVGGGARATGRRHPQYPARARGERGHRARGGARRRPALAARVATSTARCRRPPRRAGKRCPSLGADNIVLASPSAVAGFVHQVDVDTPAAIYTIGPSTTAAARAHGLAVTAEAREPSLEGVVEIMQWQN